MILIQISNGKPADVERADSHLVGWVESWNQDWSEHVQQKFGDGGVR